MWTLDQDAEYFGALRTHMPADYSVLSAYVTAAASNSAYSATVRDAFKAIAGANRWVLLQEINVEGASFTASLLYISPHDNAAYVTAFGVVGGKVYRRQRQPLVRRQTVEELFREIPSSDNVDYSESKIMDGTAAYITGYASGKLRRSAIYEPEIVDHEAASGVTARTRIARLVSKIRRETAAFSKRPTNK
jgi:hypothetical protein